MHARGLHAGAEGLGGAKPRRVFLSLLLHRGAPVGKERLVDLVWDGHPPNGCVATLETYVCLLRKRVQPLLPAGSSLIRTLAGRYAMDMSLVDLDLDRYERLAATGLRPDVPAATALPVLREALALGQHPLLPEEADDGWLADSRRSHVDHVHRTLVDAAAKVACLPGGDGPRWAEEALQGDCLDESAWLALLLGLERGGRHADGLRAYERCRRLYAAELGCTPERACSRSTCSCCAGRTGTTTS
jgi:SARP family transcriptional regulator, regulator of embCAB operon